MIKKHYPAVALLVYLIGLTAIFWFMARQVVAAKSFYGGRAGHTLKAFENPDFENIAGTIFRKSQNTTLMFELAASQSKTVDDIEYRTNSDGLRDQEYEISKPPNTKRIVFLGDSFTFGLGVMMEDTFVKQFEVLLKQRSKQELRWEVINLGVSGMNAAQEVEFLEVKGLKYSPDIVTIVYFFNDPDCPMQTILGDTDKTVSKVRAFLFDDPNLSATERANVVQYLQSSNINIERLQALQTFTGMEIESYHLGHYLPQLWNCVRASYQHLFELQQKNGFQVVVVVMPIIGAPWERYTAQRLHDFVNAEFAQYPFYLFDLKPLLEQYPGDQLGLPYTAHTNPAANKIIALALEEFFSRKGLLR